MTEEQPRDSTDYTEQQARQSWINRRRDRIVAEIQRNRRGEYKVPTWVLAVLLVVIVASWVALITLS
jgi:hypothetical protein